MSKSENLKILLVDDDSVFSRVIAKQFDSIDVELHLCEGFKDAKRISKDNHFDFVICDYDLMDGTGFEVAEHYLQKSSETPFVLISSTNRPIQDKLKNLSNVIGFVSKWDNPSSFIQETFSILFYKTGLNMALYIKHS